MNTNVNEIQEIINKSNIYKGYKLNLFLLLYLYWPFLKKYQIGIIKDQNYLDRLYRFRYEVYCERDKLLDSRKFPNKIESDEHDEYSVQFAAIDKSKNIVGSLRLIPYTDKGLPTLSEFDLNHNINNIPHKEISEISRFATSYKHRGGILMLELSKIMYLYSLQNGIKHWVGCAESWFLKKLNYFFGPIDYIGNPKFTFNAMNYPFFLSLDTAEKNVAEKSKLLFHYFSKKTKNHFF